MKKIILLGLVSAVLYSCKPESGQTKKIKRDVSLTEKTNPLSDPNIFIGKYKAKAMVLGLFHFNDAGLDSYKPKFPFNVLENKRQEELNYLLDKISKFKPTKILLEWNRTTDSVTNIKYQDFLKDRFDISNKTNEVYQIGFKLAKKLNHNRVYCSDADAKWFGVDLDWDNYDEEAYLKSQGQFEKANRYKFKPFYNLGDSIKTTQSLTEHLIWKNNPDNRLKDHQAYLTGIITGAGDNYLGADSVGRWYRRNLRIFANAYDFTDFDKEERILLIYGSGHVWQLRQLFIDSPDFDYVEVNKYLKK